MSVFAIDDLSQSFAGAAKPSFLQRLARALDAGFVNRSKRVMPVDALRRSRRDVERCRRLLRTGVRVPPDPHAALTAPRR
jgi:hypothetical protein